MFEAIAYTVPQEKSIRLASEKGTWVSEKTLLGTAMWTPNFLRRITRDHTGKLTGQRNRARQTKLGVDRHRWRTSEDERVWDTNGRVFLWSDPPPDTGHPGKDIQCRCVAVAVFD